MAKAHGGVGTVTLEGHSIRNLRVERIDDRYVVVCECGWRSRAFARMEHAVADWQRHRDRV
jgi:hypothetical protein